MARPLNCSSEELLSHLQASVEDVFQTMLNTMVTVVEPAHGPSEPRSALPASGGLDPVHVHVEAKVDFSGPQNGALILQCTAEGAMDIARGLLMLDSQTTVSLDEVKDAIGECANLVTGALKTRAFDPHGTFRLGVPQIATRSTRERQPDVGQLVFRMSEGCVAVEIWLEEPAAS